MKYDEATARRLAKIAVKKVYQHTASVPRGRATPRENELMDQRLVLARKFRETYASRQEDGSDYPYFIGVFDTVAAIASRGSLMVLALATALIAAAAATLLWAFYPAIGLFAGPHVSGAFAGAAAFIHFAPDRWWPWLLAVLAVIFLIAFAWYVTQQVKFAPEADPKRPCSQIGRSGKCSRPSGRSLFPMLVGSIDSTPCRRRSRRPAWCVSTTTNTR